MLNTTEYYDEFLRYFEMAKWQHENCNLGNAKHIDTPYDDDLMKNVHLYDVVERKYAGFGNLLLDAKYNVLNHPHKDKLSNERKEIIHNLDSTLWGLEEWLYVFFIHRLTGSGINYGKNPSGYHNSILLHFKDCDTMDDMRTIYKNYTGVKFTSKGYQIAPFPKPKGDYERGGDWFICESLPVLVHSLAKYLQKSKKSFRELMRWLEKFNQDRDYRVFRFQYGAVLADIADFFPEFVFTESHFFYGKNAKECLSYMITTNSKRIETYDILTDKILQDTGALPYNSEDIACDFIRWIENYINPKGDYSNLCMDTTWSSCIIKDHPFGRQKKMLELKLIESFNGKPHPSDDKILQDNNLTVEQYKEMAND
jgi:hypothetical protein